MLKQEFLDRVENITGKRPVVSNDDYNIIEYVYNYYPTIDDVNGKFQIATIYVYGGMPVIYDMMNRANMAQTIECNIASERANLNASLESLESLKTEQLFNFTVGD